MMISVPTEKGEPMAEYIERETAIEAIISEPTDAHYPSWYTEKIMQIPAADVAPVVHGKWLEWYPGDCALIMTGEEMLYQCSNCWAKYPDVEGCRYCHNCGKIMDGGEQDA